MKIIATFLKVLGIGMMVVACSPGSFPGPKSFLSPDIKPQETLEYSIALGFDAILPIYDPQLAQASDANKMLMDDELIMGVAWDGAAKAYPVSVLRFQEMVNDELAGIPILVTW